MNIGTTRDVNECWLMIHLLPGQIINHQSAVQHLLHSTRTREVKPAFFFATASGLPCRHPLRRLDGSRGDGNVAVNASPRMNNGARGVRNATQNRAECRLCRGGNGKAHHHQDQRREYRLEKLTKPSRKRQVSHSSLLKVPEMSNRKGEGPLNKSLLNGI